MAGYLDLATVNELLEDLRIYQISLKVSQERQKRYETLIEQVKGELKRRGADGF